ncbi:DNA photolyase [Obba rivulosa]|uniref:DNA photolyase n=1 Tax=Obba rivulosa TaxID=1052685 RepID=A0A8E2DNG3_9APHY|nr:DNA photolyase [Obba rivulosa]
MRVVQECVKRPVKGDSVVYWMRMQDMRINDNRALAQASAQAQKDNVPLLAFFVLSPQDYVAHDRSARRIDFVLRNLRELKTSLAILNIPLFTTSHTPRKTLPEYVSCLLKKWNASHVYANIEHEVDELRRDIRVCQLVKDSNTAYVFVHDKCVIPPGVVTTKDGRGYTVYSPWLRSWLPHLVPKSDEDPLTAAPRPTANTKSIHEHPVYRELFDAPVPEAVEGFTLSADEKARITTCWPAGEDTAEKILERFLQTSARSSQLGTVSPLSEGAVVPIKNPDKNTRIGKYKDARDRVDVDTTSRLSPYLAAGIISARHCIRATLELSGNKKKVVDASKESGVGRWVQEIAWRDFYTHIVALYPRVSMGRPFQEKFADVQWETNEEHLRAWKNGQTGVPIVDAAMRQARTMGWMHNRMRMTVAMYLVKDLMIDWRLGEKYFMEVLIDGDLASNNGGWQWSASTGVDPAPYFRVFNPYSQSQKADPTGNYIRYFVPELAKVRGPEVHNPPPALADKLGYPRPFVKHEEARQRAIRRYKNPGQA